MKTTKAQPAGEPVRMLLAAADRSLGAELARALARCGLHTDRIHWGGDLRRALLDRGYHCVLLGCDLPDLPGEAALRMVRDLDATQSLIVITGPLDMAERIRLLDAGADDHLTLPIDAAEVAARVRAVLRRANGAHAAFVELVHGPLCLRLDRRSATWHGREVPLTGMEFWLLETLVRRKQQALSRSTLEELIYGWSEQTGSNTVEVHVHHLRRKFDRRLIRTLRGVGYQLGQAEDLANRS
jgi:two-component system response regulator QseB